MLLAVDTSTKQIGLALHDGEQVIGEWLWNSRHHHTIELAPSVSELLNRTGVRIDDLKALGIALGPGSFTSLRVGLSFVKGLASARCLPIVGVPTLDIVATAQTTCDLPLVAILQAGRGRLAICWYRSEDGIWKAKSEAQVVTIEELAHRIHKPTIVCGELTAEERQRLMRKRAKVILPTPSACVRRPSVLAEIAWERWQAGVEDNATTLAPVYLHLANPIP